MGALSRWILSQMPSARIISWPHFRVSWVCVRKLLLMTRAPQSKWLQDVSSPPRRACHGLPDRDAVGMWLTDWEASLEEKTLKPLPCVLSACSLVERSGVHSGSSRAAVVEVWKCTVSHTRLASGTLPSSASAALHNSRDSP